MKVSNQMRGSAGIPNGQPLEVKIGDIFVQGASDQADQVSKVIESLGTNATSELKEAVKEILNQEIPLNKENIKDLKIFFEKAPGTVEQKLETIKAMVDKKLEITAPQLQAVHEALHGGSLSKALMALGKEFDPTIEEKIAVEQIQYEKIFAELKDKIDPFREEQAAKENEQYDIAQILGGMELSTKTYGVTEITEKLALAAKQFQDTKKEIVRNLDHMLEMTNNIKANATPQAKQLMESTIDVLDKAILKSQMTLFMDMKLEKKLMIFSSQLAEAKKSLAKGENAKAREIINEVKSQFEKINWKPSNTKIIHTLTEENIKGQRISQEISPKTNQEASLKQQLFVQLGNRSPLLLSKEASPRAVFESIRSLGLNYESEAAQLLSSSNENKGQQEDIQRNIKNVIMKLIEGETSSTVQSRGLDKVINNLTGQQLLSKLDSESDMQSMFLNLPIQIGDQQQNLKVHIKARKEGQKMDWENCNLYFLVDTKNIGETGIMLSAVDRNLSITFKNDHQNFKQRFENTAEKFKENLKEIGYRITGLSFQELNVIPKPQPQQAVQEEKANTMRSQMISKGFDFKA